MWVGVRPDGTHWIQREVGDRSSGCEVTAEQAGIFLRAAELVDVLDAMTEVGPDAHA